MVVWKSILCSFFYSSVLVHIAYFQFVRSRTLSLPDSDIYFKEKELSTASGLHLYLTFLIFFNCGKLYTSRERFGSPIYNLGDLEHTTVGQKKFIDFLHELAHFKTVPSHQRVFQVTKFAVHTTHFEFCKATL